MAGGWEEVDAAGSWIGTGVGTGVRVSSECRAGVATESKDRAGEAAANE
jgi:hypothetical protein